MKYVTKCREGLLQRIQDSSDVLWRAGQKPTEYACDTLICLHEDEAVLDMLNMGDAETLQNDEFVSACARLKPKMAYITGYDKELLEKIKETGVKTSFRGVELYFLLLQNSQLYFVADSFVEGALCVDNKTFLDKCRKYPREKTKYTFQRLETAEVLAYSYDEAYEKVKDRSGIASSWGPWSSK